MFSPRALTFFRQLKSHNDREWFLEHKAIYDDEVIAPLRELVEELDVRFARMAPEIVGDPKRSLFRIYRDVRFSKDKSPYKTHAATWFYHRDAGRGVGQEAHGGAGLYFHLEPGQSMIGAGLWMPAAPALKKIRAALDVRHREFAKIVAAPSFTRRFGKLSQEETRLQRVPKGFSPDHPGADWLKYKSFTVGRRLTDREVTSKKLIALVEKDFAVAIPLVRWLNGALGFPPAARR